MKVLLSAETPLTLTSHQSVIRELGRRGHEVAIAIHEEREIGWRDRLLEAIAAPHVTVEAAPQPAGDRWLSLAADLRSSVDLLQFLGPRFNDTYRKRAWKRAPRPAAALARTPLGRTEPTRRALSAGFELAERAVPTSAQIERWLSEHEPDLVLFTPYMGLRSAQPDFLRAAQALGLRNAVLVKSWDNLTSKSVIRPKPDRLFVWNHIQREEAKRLHGIDPGRVVVTGAQTFDEWFDWQPRPREEFAERAGLDAARTWVLYVGCSPWTGQSEAPFVRRWRDAIDPELQVLVRPHPKRPNAFDELDLAVFPREGHAPTDDESKADYFDSIHHSAAVVGLNTSAMIEAAILRKPVLTVLDPEYAEVQQGTLHFEYLLELLVVARTLEEHRVQLGRAIAEGDLGRSEPFVRKMVRPHGLDVAATPLFVDELERFAASAAPRRQRTPAVLRPLRPLLAPLAARAGR